MTRATLRLMLEAFVTGMVIAWMLAYEPTYVLVVDQQEHPIAGIRVDLVGDEGAWVKTTDAKGRVVYDTRPGRYTVQVSETTKERHYEIVEKVTLEITSRSTTLRIVLYPIR
jgi:hypothetical protein